MLFKSDIHLYFTVSYTSLLTFFIIVENLFFDKRHMLLIQIAHK